MLKHIAVNIMQQIAPACLVICVLLCLSLNYTFPLRHRTKDLPVILNASGSQQCGSSNARKISRTSKQAPEYKATSADPHYYSDIEKHKLSGDDLRQYEQLVIMKKYPYLDMKDFELKYRSAAKNAKYVRDADLIEVETGNCRLTDDRPRVEIFSRGISGFAIPRPSNVPPPVAAVKHYIQDRGSR